MIHDLDPPSRKVLVLGGGATAQLIADELREDGFEVFFQENIENSNPHQSALPSLGDPNGLEKLRAIFTQFAQTHSEEGRALCYLHPGASIWGERPELPILGQELGLQVICPPARVLSLFSNKLNFFELAESLGIPNLLLSHDPMHSLREIEQKKFAYPLVLKAVKGGLTGGHYVVHDGEELRSGFSLWMEQVRTSCGEVIVLAERYLEGARLFVLPFVRFLDGRFRVFPVIDASLQCRHRKMIEVCPARGVESATDEQITQWARTLTASCGYVGVGTLEFLVDGSRPYLIGGSARLNKSFRLWEEVAGTGAVHWQLAAFEGRSEEKCQDLIAKKTSGQWQHGLAIRLYAEDPLLQLPQPGFLQEVVEQKKWIFPGAEGVLDHSVGAGQTISPFSSGLLGVLRVGSQSASQLITVARGILDEVWFAGSLQTNERFIAELLDHPWVQEGIFHSGFVDEEFLPSIRPHQELLSAFATVCAWMSPSADENSSGIRWAVGDQWVKPDPEGPSWIEEPLVWRQKNSEKSENGISGQIRVRDGRLVRICAFPIRTGKWQVRVGNWILVVRKVISGGKVIEKSQRQVLALTSGRIHSLLFQEGALVLAHEPLLMIESLRTLVPHAVPVDIRICRWKVSAEDLVNAGDEVLDFEVISKS